MIAIVLAGLTLGVLSSFHCVGMCGPIALSLPVHQYSTIKKYWGIFIYNLGRAITYSVLGLIFGLLGQTFFLGELQQNVSILLGVVILFYVVFTYSQWSKTIEIKFVNKWIVPVKLGLSKLFNKKGIIILFGIGLLNGLLPCGMVYMSLAAAAASGTYVNGAIFMFSFGIGTIPVMFSLILFGQYISVQHRSIIRRLVPVMITVMALLLIVRGLNLGIPILSPSLKQETVVVNHEAKKRAVMKCCVRPVHDTIMNSSTENFKKSPEHYQ